MIRSLSIAVVVSVIGPAVAVDPVIDFNRDIRPILSNNCFACHGPDEKVRKGDLRLDTFEGATGRDGGMSGIEPGKPDMEWNGMEWNGMEWNHRMESSNGMEWNGMEWNGMEWNGMEWNGMEWNGMEWNGIIALIERITDQDPDVAMPPARTGKKLTPKDVALLKAWIKQGANYSVHWSYSKPVRPVVPLLKVPTASPIDAFILDRLKRENLKPSSEADRLTLIRRVALDLTGLPPTVKEADEFLADSSADAYGKMVDRMLAKPAFGEHWARMWLDLARYADSAGYADDPPRVIWLYRDYVIKSFNANKRFDEFTIEQIAGDLLPKPTDEQLIATAFHRNTMTNSEGGTSDEEFRSVAVVDRVNTTLAVWMGTSLACAQCHHHKYEPISQTEFFRLFAIFNNTADADRNDEAPVLTLDDMSAKRSMRQSLQKHLDVHLKKMPNKEDQAAHRKLAEDLRKQIAALQPKLTVPILRELAAKERRVTRLQHRGNFLDVGDVVAEGVPAAFHPLPKDQQVNRLALARWLVSKENPLTARVTVNRFWEQMFGTGLVRTSEEFGSQGELPSHPELLDWLAVEFMERNWDVKNLLKQIVMSAAYRQSSKVTPTLQERDPENRLYARGPRFRLTAEMLRDQALFASGLLSPKMHGRSVRPVKPNLGLSAAFGGGLDWQPSSGEDRFRRGIYTEWRRTSPYPSMQTFDAPSREACTLRRSRSNTPLQALVMLNDPVFLEAAQALARKTAVSGVTVAERIRFAFRECLTRPPTDAELKRIAALFEETKTEFAKDPKKAAEFAASPVSPRPTESDAVNLAAWTAVCNVLLNLDEMVMKR